MLHFPGKEKSADFTTALQRKLDKKDFNLSGVWFPEAVSFNGFDFSAAAYFNRATFSAKAEFESATFSGDADFSGATFDANGFFTGATFSALADFSEATFEANACFSGATFTALAFFAYAFIVDADFSNARFSAEADFEKSTFSANMYFNSVIFSAEASFSAATFSVRANFRHATFSAKADFREATFSAEADFSFATFNAAADFSFATFDAAGYFLTTTFSGDAEFINCTLSGKMDFWNAIFKDHVNVAGDESTSVFSSTSSLDLQFARFEKPDRVSFHTLPLHPHWFINVDPRKFDFTNVQWSNSGKAKLELELLRSKDASPDKTQKSPAESSEPTDSEKARKAQIKKLHRLLAIACQRLAVNCEENGRYRSASHFRRMALDAERLETWHGFDVRRLNWWYWLASGYGEKPFQALMVLLAILLLFGAFYTQVGFARWEPRLASEAEVAVAKRDEAGAPLKFSRALTYSAGVMTLQRPEPKPVTTAAQTLVLLETILGPVQAALLALAIRRKFMR